MSNTPLSPELTELTTKLADALTQDPTVIASKARIGLFFQNQEATDIFRSVQQAGEKIREMQMGGMQPSDEDIENFDKLRQAVLDNELCKSFLESRQNIDAILASVNQYMHLSIDLGRAPTPEEVAKLNQQQMSGGCGCGCSEANCEDCKGDCDCGDDCKCKD